MIGRFVDIDTLHMKAWDVVSDFPVGVLPDLRKTLAQRFSAVVNADVPNGADVLECIQAWDFANIVMTRQR